MSAMASASTARSKTAFDPGAFLVTIGEATKPVLFPKKQTIFAQGEPADAVFYLQTGKIKLTVLAKTGKEATIGILSDGSFFGEGALAGQKLRMYSATSMTDCAALRILKKAMLQALHREHRFSDLFVEYLLGRNIRYEEDLVDHFSIPARSAWREYFCCWLILVTKANLNP
jgi:CRP/FNR family transcriptional regulator, cyclic AMP receptor protein